MGRAVEILGSYSDSRSGCYDNDPFDQVLDPPSKSDYHRRMARIQVSTELVSTFGRDPQTVNIQRDEHIESSSILLEKLCRSDYRSAYERRRTMLETSKRDVSSETGISNGRF